MHLRNPQDTFLYWSEKSCVWSTPTWCRSIFQVCYQNPKFLVGTKHIWVWSKSANNEGAEAWSFSSRYHRVKQPFSGTDSAGEGPMFAWDRPSNKCSPLWHFAHHSQRRNIVQIHCFDPTCPQHGLDLDPLGSNLALSGWTWHNLAPSWTRLGATSAQVEPRPLSPGDIAARRWTAFSLVFSTFFGIDSSTKLSSAMFPVSSLHWAPTWCEAATKRLQVAGCALGRCGPNFSPTWPMALTGGSCRSPHWAGLAHVKPDLRPNVPCWTPVGLEPSGTSSAQVMLKWAQARSRSANLRPRIAKFDPCRLWLGQVGPCSSPRIPNYQTPQLRKVIPDLHNFKIIGVRAVFVAKRLEYDPQNKFDPCCFTIFSILRLQPTSPIRPLLYRWVPCAQPQEGENPQAVVTIPEDSPARCLEGSTTLLTIYRF